ncbi:lymphocyte-specific protein 1 [Perognathus longimembris pacificus]|uniref:lymphocyte-specific protein 1 n=1 Tax=Perognathus longimembris pacificus TaxID=214514 RepID=UPI002019FE7B|nr:lymphocyte-specific protein 1 [Perognathus longimembris pacificus]
MAEAAAGGSEEPELLAEDGAGPKSSEGPEVDEDEGFGDWSQKPAPWQPRRGAEGTVDGGAEPPRSKSPEGAPAEAGQARPGQHAWERTGSHGPSRPHVHPEDLHLSQEGPDPVEHWAGGGCGTPSPLLRGGTTEPGSPPTSPSIKLADRTESPNRSVEKSDRVKRSPPAPPVSAIDARLQRYAQAAEAAGRALRPSRQTSIDLPGTAVASARSLWETGEGHTPPAPKTPPCKDIVAGDMSKRSLWEGSGGGKTSSTIKSTPAGRRYRFVAAGHGKYEKVFVDEDSAP